MSVLRIFVAAVLLIGLAAWASPASASPEAFKKCGKVADPKRSSQTVKVIIQAGKIECAKARGVIRRALGRIPLPRTVDSESISFRVYGRKWSCYVSRGVGQGDQTDYVCTTTSKPYLTVSAGP